MYEEAQRPDPGLFIALFPTGFQTNTASMIQAIQGLVQSVLTGVVSVAVNV
jgi:hypothetical protein